MLSDAKARKMKPGDKPVKDVQIKGLYLFPSTAIGNGKWVLRFTSPETGKRRDMGLGTYPIVSIRSARDYAFELRQKIDDGIDPLEERSRLLEIEQKHLSVPTFEKAARTHHADLLPGFRNAKHQNQWINTLEAFVFPKIGKRLVNELSAQDFANCLRPIWLTKPETAGRVKQRCDAVMNWCAANGHIVASPVSVVVKLLPKQPGKRERVQHQPAMPWRELSGFFSNTLHEGPPTMSKIMLEVLILTAVRSGEIRHMTWDEIDFDRAVWTIPASRMKANADHRIPLNAYLRSVFKTLKEHSVNATEDLEKSASAKSVQKRIKKEKIAADKCNKNLVFKSRNETPVSDMALTKFLRDWEIASDTPGRFATAHGFRSSFRDWASENGYPRDLAEKALAHRIKNAVEAAYHRTDLLEQRRDMMNAWADYCLSKAECAP